ncbi:MAG: TolB family protein [Thermoleophilia bacterium]
MGFFTALVLFFAALASAAAAPVQITTDPANQGRPELHGNIIVWKDLRAGNWDIYSYNLSTEKEEAVSTSPAYQNLAATNGTTIFWQDNRAGDWDIYYRSVLLGLEQPLVSGAGNQGLAVVDGNNVVYVDDSSGNNDIYSINFSTRAITAVCTNTASQWQPRISGTLIVWEDNRNGSWDIYMKDLSGGDEQRLTSSPGDEKVADISGGIVVWQSTVGGVTDIHMMKLNTGNQAGDVEAVTSDAATQNSPRVSGDLITWEDGRNSSWDIYMKDLTSGITSALASGPSVQARQAIDRETVVWEQDTAAGDYDIWMTTVPDETPPAISGLTPAEGEQTGCGSPAIMASYSDNRVGVDTTSVNLIVDGEDVTALSTISAGSIFYTPSVMASGLHSATLTVADLSGNSASSSWQFYSSQPVMRLKALAAYWASYADYLKRELSVPYQLINPSAEATNFSVEIQATTTTAGVILATNMPVWLGDIGPGNHGDAELKYLIPENTQSFKTTVFASSYDACSAVYYFPGPPPDS